MKYPSTQRPHFHLFLSKEKKRIKKKTTSIVWAADSVNSGFARRKNSESIVVFREEEFFKVCMHELIHAMGWDIEDDGRYGNTFISSFRIETMIPVYLNEAYTETWAILMNIIRCSKDREDVSYYLDIERSFSLFQTAKILHHSGFKNYESFYNDASSFPSEPSIKQETSIFSYFILRSAFFFDLNWLVTVFHDIPFGSRDPTYLVDQAHFVFSSTSFSVTMNRLMDIVKRLHLEDSIFDLDMLRLTAVEVKSL